LHTLHRKQKEKPSTTTTATTVVHIHVAYQKLVEARANGNLTAEDLQGQPLNKCPTNTLWVRLVNPAEGRKNAEKNLAEIKTRIPKRAFDIINHLVSKGYFSSVADFARQSILDKLINDFEIGISELEPQIVKPKHDKKKEYVPMSSSANLEA